ncbi:MAG: MFS transporter [Nanoarchaeota archaeon]
MIIGKDYQRYKKILFLEGGLSFAGFTLLNGIFLIGFALALGANEFQLGILLAIPLFANLLQIVSAFILEKTGTKKWTTIISLSLGRGLWLVVVLIAFMLIDSADNVYLFGVILLFSSLFSAIGNLALLSWIKDLVPVARLGRFLGKRNMYASLGGAIVYLAGAGLIDKYKSLESYGFIFLFALMLGLIATFLFKGIPEKKKRIKAISVGKFSKRLCLCFKDAKFKPLLYFGILWGFSVNIAAPFILVYLINDLKMSFFYVTIFLLVDTVFRIYGLNLWRHIADTFGARPTLIISATATTLTPLAFLFINKTDFLSYTIIAFIFIVGAVSYAGVDISIAQVLFKTSPRKYDAYYLSAFSSLIGLSSALGPIIGGYIAVLIRNSTIPLHNGLRPLQYVFLISFLLRVICVQLISKIHEDKAREVNDIIERMRSLKLASFFINYYSIADYTSKIVLMPQKQLFILQRKTMIRLTKDVEKTKSLLLSIKQSLDSFKTNKLAYYKTRFKKLDKNLNQHVLCLEYIKPTTYYNAPNKILTDIKILERKMEEKSRQNMIEHVQKLKKSVERSHIKLVKLVEKKVKI